MALGGIMTRILMLMVVLFAASLAEAANVMQADDRAFYADLSQIEQARFRTEEELAAFRKQVAELDQKWLSQDADHRALLFMRAAESINLSNFGNSREQYKYGQEYALQGLENAFTDQISLEREIDLVRHLTVDIARTDDLASYVQERTLKARLWIHAWRRLEEEAAMNFPHPKEVPAVNVPAPPGSGALPGESPEVIKDPKLRREYEEAIQANQRKAELVNKGWAHDR